MKRSLSAGLMVLAVATTSYGQVADGPAPFPPPEGAIPSKVSHLPEAAPPTPASSEVTPAGFSRPAGPPIRQSHPSYEAVYPAWGTGAGVCSTCDFGPADVFADYQVWFNTEYTLWYFRKFPISVPLVTTTTSPPGPGSNILGIDPNTRVIMGQESIEQDPRNGGRVTLGAWLDKGRSVGFEVVGLWIENPTERYGIYSNSVGSPLLSRPINLTTGGPGVYDISFPGSVRGTFVTEVHQLFQSIEGNVVGFAFGDAHLSGTVLLGGRFINFEEDLSLIYNVQNLVALPGFGGQTINPNTTVTASDQYRAINQFSGGQIGAKFESIFGRFSVGISGRVAFGVNNATMHVEGITGRNDTNVTYPAGVLANGANIGRYTETFFACVPEGSISFGWFVCPNVRLNAGYNFLYMSSVVRPGNQISNLVNPAAVPVDPTFGTAAVTRNPPPFTRTDFWAEGITIGIDFRY